MTDSLLVQLRKGVLDMCVLALLARRMATPTTSQAGWPTRSAWVKARSIP